MEDPAVNALAYDDLWLPLVLGAIGVCCAGLLHRTIVRSPGLLGRRHFLETLAAFGFGIALLLLASGLMLWRDNPRFVLACSATWMLACAVAVLVLRRADRRRTHAELTLPDTWPSAAEHSVRVADTQRPHPASPRTDAASRTRPVSLDASARTRLKKARRERQAGGGHAGADLSAFPKRSRGRGEE